MLNACPWLAEPSCALASDRTLMHSPSMGAENLPSAIDRLRARTELPHVQPPLTYQPAQVAAVCYRVRGAAIEFLLVRTRKGRWTFPKGGAEAGLTHSQAAALEAFEEAGVHGRIEAGEFTRYRRGKPYSMQNSTRTIVHAHLCEVLRLLTPQEPDRNRTWFSPEKAKSQLRENRNQENATDLARTIDCAVSRIQRIHKIASVPQPSGPGKKI